MGIVALIVVAVIAGVIGYASGTTTRTVSDRDVRRTAALGLVVGAGVVAGGVLGLVTGSFWAYLVIAPLLVGASTYGGQRLSDRVGS